MHERGGWVALYRRVLDSWVWQLKPEHRCVALTCLLMANWKPGSAIWKDGQIDVPRGSFITSWAKLSKRAGVSVMQTRRAVNNLRSRDFLTSEATTRYQMISIVNFDYWQDPRHTTDIATDNPQTNDRQTTDNNRTKNKEQTNKEDLVDRGSAELFELEPVTAPKPKAKRCHAVTRSVVDFLNRKANRQLNPTTHDRRVRGMLKLGYTERELRVVIWHAVERLRTRPDRQSEIHPATLFKTRAPPQYPDARVFDDYLEAAVEAWNKKYKAKPFDRDEPFEGGSNGG